MASNEVLETILGLATTFGSSIGLVLAGILTIAFLLIGLDRAKRLLGGDKTSAQ